MTTNTGRIDIQGQFGIFNSQRTKVERTMPAILNGHMSNYEWNQLRHKLNETVAPLSGVKGLQVGLMVALLLAFVSLTVAVYMFVEKKTEFYSLFVVAGLAMLGCIAIPIYISWFSGRVQRELSRVCDEESARNSQISFHVRFEPHYYGTTNYIEVQVSGDAPPRSVVPSMWAEPETVVVNTAEERLEELERIKPHLSYEEYQRKRQEILAAV